VRKAPHYLCLFPANTTFAQIRPPLRRLLRHLRRRWADSVLDECRGIYSEHRRVTLSGTAEPAGPCHGGTVTGPVGGWSIITTHVSWPRETMYERRSSAGKRTPILPRDSTVGPGNEWKSVVGRPSGDRRVLLVSGYPKLQQQQQQQSLLYDREVEERCSFLRILVWELSVSVCLVRGTPSELGNKDPSRGDRGRLNLTWIGQIGKLPVAVGRERRALG